MGEEFDRSLAEDISGEEFEFAFTSIEPDSGAMTEATADEIFANGRILPVYPIFNQSLVTSEELDAGISRLSVSLEKQDHLPSVSSEADDLGAYCVWSPRSAPQSPDQWRKSRSTGSALPEPHRFKLRDLVVGRSRSDGKEKLTESEIERAGYRSNPTRKPAKDKGKGKSGDVKEMDVVTAHRIYYGKGTAAGRRSFLPYQQQLLGGFFGHGKHNPF